MRSIGWAVLENIATLGAITAITLGIYAMGGGLYGFWSLVLLLNLNTGVRVKSNEPTK